ncbi:hypothetical protein Tco_0335211 [Tanacetum coccineum]
MEDPNITMEEYIRLEEEKAHRHGKAALSCEPKVSPLYNNEINFRISFDESDDEDYTLICPLFHTSPTVKLFDDLDYLKIEVLFIFPAIVYNDSLTFKSDFLTER